MMIKVIGLSLVALTATAVLKNIQPWLVQFVIISSAIIVFLYCLDNVKDTLYYFYDICNSNKYGGYFKVMLKGLGVAYLSCIGGDICRDSGESGLASRIELAAKLEIFVIALPLVKSLIELSENILLI